MALMAMIGPISQERAGLLAAEACDMTLSLRDAQIAKELDLPWFIHGRGSWELSLKSTVPCKSPECEPSLHFDKKTLVCHKVICTIRGEFLQKLYAGRGCG